MKENNFLTGSVITKERIDYLIKVNRIPLWVVKSYADITEKLSNANFPCLFGRHSWKLETILFSFISKENRTKDIISSFSELTNITKIKKEEERLYSPLLCIFEETKFNSIEEEQSFAWKQLQILHDNDIGVWPDSIPEDPECSEWTFCFNDIELFINISCPGHKKIISRNLGDNIIFVVNPRKHFDIVANANDPKGVKIREKIRSRVKIYNNDDSPLELGFYGDHNNREWKQYALHEPGSDMPASCPLKIKKIQQ
ncbi:TPA: YqcI/YcgG family protein [Salmonella enterica subsp. diarizonae serovar 61:i:z]